MSKKTSWWKKIASILGPGFITGAADDDPSGIATYSQTGAMFGFSQLWIVLFTYPFMVVVQEMCGRIGLVTGRGLSGVIKRHYSRTLLYGVLAILFLANAINIGADLGAMAASAQLILPVPLVPLLVAVTGLILVLEIFVPYPKYARLLRYLTLSLLAYVVTVFIIGQDWALIARSTLIPTLIFSKEYLLNIVALLGTTISPYLFFWQADEEVEEEIADHRLVAIGQGKPKFTDTDVRAMRVDTATGMFFSQLITFFIMITVASTIGPGRIVATAAEAAEALRPVAGNAAFLLFTLGIFGTGLLAIPVLAGSTAYAFSEAFDRKAGLGRRPKDALFFYGMIVLVTLVGVGATFLPIPPITLLYYSAVLNGILAPPLMVLILLIAKNKKVMGDRTNSVLSNILGWTITLVMGGVAIALVSTMV